MVFKSLFARKEPAPPRLWSMPAGERAYAIGDIHGRRDLLDTLLEKIDADDAARGPSKTSLIFLGDLCDRGPDSKGVVERLMQLSQAGPHVVFLSGNHEELVIRVWEGDRGSAGTFNRAGGRETLASYGIDPAEYDTWDLGEVTDATGRAIPAEHVEFMRGFREWHRMGDYLFVHAGIRPGYALEEQETTDLRWIRREFTESDEDFGMLVIHGHTITKTVDERANRIGIDTGAYASGTLTAIGLEGTDRWYLST